MFKYAQEKNKDIENTQADTHTRKEGRKHRPTADGRADAIILDDQYPHFSAYI